MIFYLNLQACKFDISPKENLFFVKFKKKLLLINKIYVLPNSCRIYGKDTLHTEKGAFVAQVMFLHVSVILFTVGGWSAPWHAGIHPAPRNRGRHPRHLGTRDRPPRQQTYPRSRHLPPSHTLSNKLQSKHKPFT